MSRQAQSCFNPRAREGRDDIAAPCHVRRNPVSIHAPVKGATAVRRSAAREYSCFNPRAREGRDPAITAPCDAAMFQSTRP